jgi:pimeloyl-ACP methyl ester carboxylesterase
LSVAILVLAAAAAAFYFHFDQERLTMDDAARQSAEARAFGGSYVRLPVGVTHYELAGPEDAQTVVMVHGFSVPYFIWDPAFDALNASGFRVLRYDTLGRGFSDRPAVRYDPALFDDQLSQLLTALKIHLPVDIVCLSMGGPVTANFASRHPENVRRLVFFDPGYGRGDKVPPHIRAPIVGEFLMDVQIAPGMPASQREDFVHPERYSDYFAKYETQMHYKGFRRAILSTMRDFLSQDNTGAYVQVGKSGKPVMLIWGRADTTVPFAVSDEVRKAIPQAEFHPIDDAGHVPFYEHPEIVNPLVIEFLKR